MTYQVIVAPAATRESQGIFDWLKTKSPQGAADWYHAYTKAVADLRENPELWPVADESPRRRRVIRQVLFRTKRGRRYRLLFAIEAGAVLVLHVRAPGQKPI